MSSTRVPDVVPEIKIWLGVNWKKITSFWLHADWRMWARYDLYAHLESTMGKEVRKDYPRSDFRVSHSQPLWVEEMSRDVDLTVGPAAEQKMKDVAIWICAQRPGENDTSFPDFAEKFQQEWALVQELTKKNSGGDLEGGKLLFLGIGEKAYDDDLLQFGGLKPDYFGFGGSNDYEATLYAYYLWLDLPEAKE